MNNTLTVSSVLKDYKKAKEIAKAGLYHIALCTLKHPFMDDFRSKDHMDISLIEKIVEQLLNEKKEQAYYMPINFLQHTSEDQIKEFNAQNELFTIFMKDPNDENRKVTVTLK